MSRRPLFFIVLLSILMISHRSPAPIVEEEKPTPAPQEEAPKSSKSKRKSVENSEMSKPAEARKPKETSKPRERFAGVWTGTISIGILGTIEETLTINSAGTVVGEKNSFGSATHQATCDGTTVKFQAGALNEIAFTVTPNPDGQTAIVTANSIFISNPSVTFRKTPNSEAAASSIAMPARAEFPTAKPVPERPGFVYNPFDPTSRIFIDVRGKPSGSKLIDPKSGKTFLVP